MTHDPPLPARDGAAFDVPAREGAGNRVAVQRAFETRDQTATTIRVTIRLEQTLDGSAADLDECDADQFRGRVLDMRVRLVRRNHQNRA